MTGIDYVLAAGMAVTSVIAGWYQVRYYKLVDDLISALSGTSEENK